MTALVQQRAALSLSIGTGAPFEVTLGRLSEITGELWVYSNVFANGGFIQKEEQTSMRNMVRN